MGRLIVELTCNAANSSLIGQSRPGRNRIHHRDWVIDIQQSETNLLTL